MQHRIPDGWVPNRQFPPGVSAWTPPEGGDHSNMKARDESPEIATPGTLPPVQSALNVEAVGHHPRHREVNVGEFPNQAF